MSRSALHQAALDLAAQGVPVFPCYARTKKPATEKGFHDATVDASVIDGWWSEDPQYNVAFQPQRAGWAVIDPDGEEGIRNWENLIAEHGEIPETYTVRTPRGGLHEYYGGPLAAALGPSQSKLGEHIDTRGGGSYVLAPPSVFFDPSTGKTGVYTVEIDAPKADLPPWVPEVIGKARAKAKAASEVLDQPANIARAIALLKVSKPAVEGEMGDGHTYALACEVLNLGVSEDMALELMLAHWNDRCDPPWDEADLAIKVSNAAAYAQNEPGAWAVEPAREVFGAALDQLAHDNEPAPAHRSARFKLWTLEEIGALPPPAWIIPDLFPDKGLSLLFGPPGSYKSFIALQLALELAAGMYEGGPKPVVYIGAEGGRGLEVRAKAWMVAQNISEPLPLYVVQNMPWASDPEMVVEFIGMVKASGVQPSLVVIDTAARMMLGLNENDARDVGRFIQAIDEIKLQLNCAVLAVHHTGKDESRGARGSGALTAAVDAAFEIKAEKTTRAVAMYCRRQKDTEEREEPWTYEGRPFAGSLVFFATTLAEHRALTRVDDALAPKKIGQALADLNARGLENGVSTHVLAGHLVPQDAETNEDARTVHVGQVARVLGQRAKGSLEAYAHGTGQSMTWSLPS